MVGSCTPFSSLVPVRCRHSSKDSSGSDPAKNLLLIRDSLAIHNSWQKGGGRKWLTITKLIVPRSNEWYKLPSRFKSFLRSHVIDKAACLDHRFQVWESDQLVDTLSSSGSTPGCCQVWFTRVTQTCSKIKGGTGSGPLAPWGLICSCSAAYGQALKCLTSKLFLTIFTNWGHKAITGSPGPPKQEPVMSGGRVLGQLEPVLSSLDDRHHQTPWVTVFKSNCPRKNNVSISWNWWASLPFLLPSSFLGTNSPFLFLLIFYSLFWIKFVLRRDWLEQGSHWSESFLQCQHFSSS